MGVDREKVIKGLSSCKKTDCINCPYNPIDGVCLINEMLQDALALLKEQDAEWLEVDDKHDAFDCSNCGAMASRKCLYCPGCGAKMKNGIRAMKGR